ncbi:hypothetical protein SEA_PAOLA_35 [Mycobacterium phage Paola]|uniref:Uncharacterized protein n=4 Tax=Kratiovirus TaxID=2948788 RepID=A0A345M963_9CAUD|nr:hypothetical protein PBI_OKIROE_35 [Mycobacterium phage OkiRoe]YP_009282280.1 hypothetical protein SEA_GENGAR_35 [Mycobacterium phage Gengar]YP_009950747.1 hypothetical protein I5G73_gp64 [Mycobacterium phage Leston]YP_009950841.1 hypothetical protein I5G74_gp62 [Mycobacterium phage Paola]YP_009951024.1 hypothetical protein I5G76_gp66 [Mycobacterium phage Thyatira]ASR85823.1 hypothetical protein SEA_GUILLSMINGER_35 [Mycobacterium phage Guillsminger]QXN73778.1 hypothetical protein SEA_SOSEP
MRSEHVTTADEWDACTRWRRVMIWRPGERKRIKQRSHRRDRRAARQAVRVARR